MERPPMDRRKYLTLLGAGSLATLAGCAGQRDHDNGGASGGENSANDSSNGGDSGDNGTDDTADDDTGTLNGWDIADEEEEAWRNLQAGLSTVRASEQASDENLQQAQNQLEDAVSAYRTLNTQSNDKLSGQVQLSSQVYCNRLIAAAEVGQSAVTVALNGANPEMILGTLDSQMEKAESIYDNTDELQDATRGERF